MSMAASWLDLMWGAFWQGAAALGIVWAVCKAFPRIPAGARCWLWRLGLAKPLLCLLGTPHVSLPLLPRARTLLAAIVSADFAQDIPTRSALKIVFTRPVLLMFIGVLSVGGACVAAALWWARSRQAQCGPLPAGDDAASVRGMAHELCARLRLSRNRRPEVLVASWAAVPVTLRSGPGCTVVVIPQALLDPARRGDLSLALAHELAHVKRRDLEWNWLPIAARLVFFMNPLVWVASRELALAQEMACDETAVRTAGARPARYGALLLSMVTARAVAGPVWAPAAVAAGAPAADIRRRLIELKQSLEAPPVSRAGAAILALAFMCAIVMPFRIVEAPRGLSHVPGRDRGRILHLADDSLTPSALRAPGDCPIMVDACRG